MPEIIDGKKLAANREIELRKKVQALGFTPNGVNILIGDDPSSVLYTQIKEKKAKELGICFQTLRFSLGGVSEPPPRWDDIALKIKKLNEDENIHGFMVQLPLPEEFLEGHTTTELLDLIDTPKDIDGLRRGSAFIPAAVKAMLWILEDENINVDGKNVVVVGSSDLVGKPASFELEKLGGLVTICDNKTKDLASVTKEADILVSATGVPHLIKGDMVKDGVVIIDIGAEKIDGKLLGDVEFSSVYPRVSKITPVPGGVGPLTVIALMEAVVEAAERN